MIEQETVDIQSRDFWFKVVEMLQQNWALIEEDPEGGVTVYFIHDGSGVFDQMDFTSREEAGAALRRNGFERYEKDVEWQKFIAPPRPPFWKAAHPNGPIYSSGRFWRYPACCGRVSGRVSGRNGSAAAPAPGPCVRSSYTFSLKAHHGGSKETTHRMCI